MSLVSEWGFCGDGRPDIGCDALTDRPAGPFGGHLCDRCHEVCEIERAKRRARHEAMLAEIERDRIEEHRSDAIAVALLATLRPSAVVARREGDQTNAPDDIAVLSVPAEASRRAWLAAQAVATITTQRLQDAWSLKWALRVAAIGRDQVVDELVKLGIAIDRKTAAAGLLELQELGVMEKVGQLPAWTDPKEPDATRKTGSFTWGIKFAFRALGARTLEALCGGRGGNATLGGMRGDRRARKCLKWAIENARPGVRNAIGYWLARRCLDCGLSYAQATNVIGDFQKSVDQGCHRYTPREAMATLRSAYRRHGGSGGPVRRVTASETEAWL